LPPGGRPGFPGWNGRPRIFLGDICTVIVRLPIAHAKSLMLAHFKPTSPGAIIARISNPRTRGTTARAFVWKPPVACLSATRGRIIDQIEAVFGDLSMIAVMCNPITQKQHLNNLGRLHNRHHLPRSKTGPF
jgi:hypothetical protein